MLKRITPLVCSTFLSLTASAGDGDQFSRHDQITRENVDDLALAFEFRTGDLGRGFTGKGHSFQTMPVYWDGLLIISTSSNEVIAFDAGDGKEKWRFDPMLDRDESYSESASRGVALWHGNNKQCPDRVFHGTLDGRLFAINARTGKPCHDFGNGGEIDLGLGIQNRRRGEYSVTSPPAVLDTVLIVGSSIGDNGAVDLEQGIVRGIDPVTGTEMWRWDPIPRSSTDPAASTWADNSAAITGAANAWAPISVDPESRLAFIPTSSPSPDFYGGERLGSNEYANSLVAMHADTGEIAWYRQLVHHDLWDYDVPSEPTLTTITRGGEKIPAVVVVTKQGMLFAFNRLTGESIYAIEERPVPPSDVPGETANPTQPFSEIVLTPNHVLTEDDAFGLAFFDKRGCRQAISEARSEGLFTPPSLEGTIVYPAWTGGMNWGGVAIDEARQIAITNYINGAGIIKLFPRDEYNRIVSEGGMEGWQMTAMRGTPYGMARRMLLSSLGVPCNKPPWGVMVAVDLETAEILWQRPIGSIKDLSPVPMPAFMADGLFGDWGVPAHGGPLSTASGLTFIGATMDFYFRAFDSETGEELWRHRLPTSAHAIPMSYMHEGEQHIAIAAGGHTGAGMPRGDSLMVFRLPSLHRQ